MKETALLLVASVTVLFFVLLGIRTGEGNKIAEVVTFIIILAAIATAAVSLGGLVYMALQS